VIRATLVHADLGEPERTVWLEGPHGSGISGAARAAATDSRVAITAL